MFGTSHIRVEKPISNLELNLGLQQLRVGSQWRGPVQNCAMEQSPRKKGMQEKRERNREIGQDLARRRQALDFSQARVSVVVDLTPQHLSNLEQGKASLRVVDWEDMDAFYKQHEKPAAQGLSEDQAGFTLPPHAHPAREELLRFAKLLETKAKRIRQLAETL